MTITYVQPWYYYKATEGKNTTIRNNPYNPVMVFGKDGWEPTGDLASGEGAVIGTGGGDDNIFNGGNNAVINSGAGNDVIAMTAAIQLSIAAQVIIISGTVVVIP